MTPIEHAKTVVADFNARYGANLIALVQTNDPLTQKESWQLAERAPGWYTTTGAFMAVRGRKPTHGETINTGRMLRRAWPEFRKEGPTSFYRLDMATLPVAD